MTLNQGNYIMPVSKHITNQLQKSLLKRILPAFYHLDNSAVLSYVKAEK